jgi:type I restriction enzyme S subunit
VPGLNRNDAYVQTLWLPPLAEQKRIAAILDQADELRRKRQRSLDRLSTLGQAIFHEMFGTPEVNSQKLPKVALGDLIKVSSGIGLVAADQRGAGILSTEGTASTAGTTKAPFLRAL